MTQQDDTTRAPRAIETSYNGYRFRSRLEARWAVFLDALGVTWEYEKEGFDLGGGVFYLPDFYIVEPGYWLEIKPTRTEQHSEAWVKAALLAEHTQQYVVITTTPLMKHGWEASLLLLNPYLAYSTHPNDVCAETAYWIECPACHRTMPFTNDYASPCECLMVLVPNDPNVSDAMLKARGARFEFGEKG